MFITADELPNLRQGMYYHDAVHELLQELYGVGNGLKPGDWEKLQARADSELLLMYEIPDAPAILCMVQGTYSFRPPYPKVYVNSVIVRRWLRGQGYGQLIMREFHARCMKRWPDVALFQLTSAPRRNTRSFYEKLGYIARAHDSGNETTAFEMRV